MDEVKVEQQYTVREAAELLAIDARELRKMIRAGEVKATKLGPRRTRITESELRRVLAEAPAAA